MAEAKHQSIVRQVKYLNNIIEQDHRAIKRVTGPMLNFKSFRAARNVLAGVELMHMIREGQLMLQGCSELSFADQFHALAGKIRLVYETGTRPGQNYVHHWTMRHNPAVASRNCGVCGLGCRQAPSVLRQLQACSAQALNAARRSSGLHRERPAP